VRLRQVPLLLAPLGLLLALPFWELLVLGRLWAAGPVQS
jgi:hypothetical protein